MDGIDFQGHRRSTFNVHPPCENIIAWQNLESLETKRSIMQRREKNTIIDSAKKEKESERKRGLEHVAEIYGKNGFECGNNFCFF
jgi:hypothetical protein